MPETYGEDTSSTAMETILQAPKIRHVLQAKQCWGCWFWHLTLSALGPDGHNAQTFPPCQPWTLPHSQASPGTFAHPARANFSRENTMVKAQRPLCPLPMCPTVGCCPSRVPPAGHRSVAEPQDAKVPSVSLKQMLQSDDS